MQARFAKALLRGWKCICQICTKCKYFNETGKKHEETFCFKIYEAYSNMRIGEYES
jgi:hypothetical protein